MKILPDFTLINAETSPVIVKKGDEDNANGIPLYDEQSVFLWNYLLENSFGKEQLLHALLERFDISTVLALNYIDKFLKPLIEKGIIKP